MSAPRFKKYIKAIAVANGGTGYQITGNILTSGNQQYALDYFGENYVIYYGQTTTTFAIDLNVLISAPTSTIYGDTPVQATATLTVISGIITAITLTEVGDGYITAPTIQIIGTPTSFTNTSTIDLSRDDGTYTSVATTSLDGIGTGTTVDITVEAGNIVQILPSAGTNYRIGELLTVSPVAIGGTGSEDPINFTVSEINGGTGASFTVELGQISKSNAYHTPKVYPIIKNQIPEFVREEYPTLATFVEKYYEFNDLNTTAYGIGPTNILHTMQDRMDLGFQNYGEETKTDFLDTFFEQYGKDFPVSLAADKDILLKNIKDFYTAKGSVKGIELLFRIMYNETVEVFVPNQYTLRASDNVWSREYVIKVYANTFVQFFGDFDVYNPVELDGKSITIHYLESLGSVTTNKTKSANVTQVKEIAYTYPNAYELTLDIDPSFSIQSNGAGFAATAVVGGKIATIDTISAADASRTAGTYTISTAGSTSSVTGVGATFTVVVDGSGEATITVTAAGDSYAPQETITIADSQLGAGGAAPLTFKVATITDGKINSVTITSGGSQYTSNPIIASTPAVGDTITTAAQMESRITNGAVTSVLFTDDVQGLGYNNPPTIRSPIYPTATYISLASEDGSLPQHNKALVQRILSSAVYKSNSGAADGGFRIGDVFSVNEGALLAAYATDYFADDYTLLSLANNAFVRIVKIDSAAYPLLLEVISIGIGFQTATFDFAITSRTGASATLTATTGYNGVYPGVYKTTSGFLSNVNKLQDNKIYQAFSYQIRSNRPKSDWGEYVKRAAHPAGMIGYADLQITGTVDVGNTMSVDTDLIFYVVTPDIEVVVTQEVVAKGIVSNGHVDTLATAEPIFFTGPGLGKLDIPVMQDAAPIFDVESVLTEAYQVDESTAFVFERNAVVDTYATQDAFTQEWVALLSRADTTGAGDAVNTKDIRPVLADSVRIEDEQSLYAIDYFLEDYVANNNPEFFVEKNNIIDIYNAGDASALEFVLNDRTDTYVTQDAFTQEWVALLSRSDSYTGQDVAILHPGSAITDTYATQDAFTQEWVALLSLSEAYQVDESTAFVFERNAVVDSYVMQDAITREWIALLSRADTTGAGDTITTKDIRPVLADLFRIEDEQSPIYAIDYFLEDYIANNNPEFQIEKNNIIDIYNAGDAPALEFVLSDRTDSYTIQDTPVVVLGYLISSGDDVAMSDVVNELHTFKVSTDSVGIADAPSLQSGLPQSDSYAMQDAITREWIALLSRADTTGAGDTITTKDIRSVLADTYTAADSAAKVIENTLTTETYTVGDVATRGFNKNGISDSGALQDGLNSLVAESARTDTYVTQDAFTQEWVALLSRSDSYQVDESTAFAFERNAVVDTYATQDAFTQEWVALLSRSDSYATQDISITTPGLHKAEGMTATTTNVVTFPGINRTDVPVTTEGGSITMQDFIGSSDYFLEDYVASEVRSIS